MSRAPFGGRAEETPLERRFRERLDRRGPDECWPWPSVKTDGYGRIHNPGGSPLAHRVAYELLVGPIPDGLQLDHTCHTRAAHTCRGGPTCAHRRCVNPALLEPVTPKQNSLRSSAVPPRRAPKTHCPKGHAYAGDNVSVHKRGYRRCRTCHNADVLARYYRNKGE